MKYKVILSVGFVFGCALLATAQVYDMRASTAEEGWARGAADIIRSRADANLSNSQAASNAQDAYAKAIRNSVDSVDAYWERRRINEENRAARRQRTVSYSQRRSLQPLTRREFDRTTGEINWPEQLASPQFSKYRDEFDAIFRKRAEEGWLDSADYLRASEMSKEWRAVLTDLRGQVPTPMLSQMVRFVLKLDRELNNNLS